MYRVILSPEHNPFFHLALEHHLLYQDEFIDEQPVLLIYQNLPSVILGNFQNPWKEVNVPYCRDHKIDIVRRFSGGGCVYHDLGNINFCYIGKKTTHSRNVLHHLLCHFFSTQGIDLVIGEKADLLLKNKKISGSAFRETKNRTLHHCTFLFDIYNDHLRRSLSSALINDQLLTKALPSRPTEVTCLKLMNSCWNEPHELIQDFVNSLKDLKIQMIDYPLKHIQDFSSWKSWEQVYAKTPTFTWQSHGVEILVEAGCIKKLMIAKEKWQFEVGEIPLGLNMAGLPPKIRSIMGDDVLNLWKNIGFY